MPYTLQVFSHDNYSTDNKQIIINRQVTLKPIKKPCFKTY